MKKTIWIAIGIIVPIIAVIILYLFWGKLFGQNSQSTSVNEKTVCQGIFSNNLPEGWKVNTPKANAYDNYGFNITQVCEFNVKDVFEISVNTVDAKTSEMEKYASAFINRGATWKTVEDSSVNFNNGITARYAVVEDTIGQLKAGDRKQEVLLAFPYKQQFVILFYPVNVGTTISNEEILKSLQTLEAN